MDSTTEQYYRMCGSSSSVMFCEELKPGCVRDHKERRPDEQWDDFYLRKLNELFGDTTNADAHAQMHRWLGVNSKFQQNGTRETLEYYLSKGHGVMVGQLHHGHFTRPDPEKSHWTYCCGWTPENDSFVFHDPAGTMNVERGGYINNDGVYRKYPWDMWKRRWMADINGLYSPGSGWCFVPVVDKATGKYVPLNG